MDEFTSRIKKIIKNKGLKQNFVAEKMGIKEKKLSDILHGRKIIDKSMIQLFCDVLEVSPNELFGYDKSV